MMIPCEIKRSCHSRNGCQLLCCYYTRAEEIPPPQTSDIVTGKDLILVLYNFFFPPGASSKQGQANFIFEIFLRSLRVRKEKRPAVLLA